MASTIDSLKSNAIGDSSARSWEKTVTDVNDIDETFANARDLGQTRLNYSRITAVGELSNNDSYDIYKTSIVSKRGKLSLSLQSGGADDKVLDLSKYEDYINQLKLEFNPEEYYEELKEKEKEDADKYILEDYAPELNVQVYSTDKFGRQVLIADSTAEKDSELYNNLSLMMSGEYEATEGDYYIKVSRNDTVTSKDNVQYAVQLMMGTSFKHDYIAIENKSEDTKNETTSKVPAESSSGANYGTSLISASSALQIMASSDQGAANMLSAGYANLVNIYSKNSKS